MKAIIIAILASIVSAGCIAQSNFSIFDARHWGVVLDHPETENVKVRNGVVFLKDEKATLGMDVYLPPGLGEREQRPAIVFINAVGDGLPPEPKVKSWTIYSSWPRLVAAHGFIGISMDCDRTRIQESLRGIFSFIASNGKDHHINPDAIGVYAASANVTGAMTYLMNEGAHPGIRAAAMFYGGYPEGPYRKDLPVLFIVAETDVRGNGYSTLWNEVLKNRAPWTLQMGSGLVHGFDAFNDNDDARKVLKEAISFWKNHLEPIALRAPSPEDIGREAVAAQYGGDREKVMALLRQWLDKNPNDAEALWRYGNILKLRQQYADAESALRKAVALDPANANAKADLVVTLYAQKKSTDAAAIFSEMKKARQATRNTHVTVGIGLFILGDHREGLTYFESISEKDRIGVDYYNIACGYARLNETEKAFPPLVRAVDMGYNSKQHFENDGDLDSLRNDKRYKDLLARLR